MKPPPFDYAVASSVQDALTLIQSDDDTKVIAGGQSLIPLLNLRFASPSLLVDIGQIAELQKVERNGDTISIGATVRHATVETDAIIRESVPLLSESAPWVAHLQIRNRGTFGGAIAHGDAAAEFPAVLLATGANIVARSDQGERRIQAGDFFKAHFQTALQPDELIVAVEIPAFTNATRWGFSEFARRKGDYAIGGAAICGTINDSGVCQTIAGGLISAGPGPTSAAGLDEELVGHRVDEASIRRAAHTVAKQLTPEDNIHGSREYRRAVIAESVRRALRQAFITTDTETTRRTA